MARKYKAGDKVRITYQHPFVKNECFNKGEIGIVLNWIPFGNSKLYAIEGKDNKWMEFEEDELELVND